MAEYRSQPEIDGKFYARGSSDDKGSNHGLHILKIIKDLGLPVSTVWLVVGQTRNPVIRHGLIFWLRYSSEPDLVSHLTQNFQSQRQCEISCEHSTYTVMMAALNPRFHWRLREQPGARISDSYFYSSSDAAELDKKLQDSCRLQGSGSLVQAENGDA